MGEERAMLERENRESSAGIADIQIDYQEPLHSIEPFPFNSTNRPIKKPIAKPPHSKKMRRQPEKTTDNPWNPFPSRAAWKLAEWLMSSGLSNGDRDNFFKLEDVSFKTIFSPNFTRHYLTFSAMQSHITNVYTRLERVQLGATIEPFSKPSTSSPMGLAGLAPI